jgi:hypothetical protein
MSNIQRLINITLLFCSLLSTIVSANEAILVNNLKACVVIKQELVRLQCFDDLTKTVTDDEYNKTHSNSQSSPSSQNTVTVSIADSIFIDNQVTPLTDKQIDDFSKEKVKKTPQQMATEVNAISLTISKLSKSIRGQWQILFTNGQQWQQKDTISLRLKKGDNVQLFKGALGTVFLKKHKTNKRIKVKRLK